MVADLLFFNSILELRAEEPRRAIVAYEMLETGDFIIPSIHGETYFNKPPFFNWLVAGTMTVAGTGEWSVRFIGALSFLLIGFILFKILRKHFDRETGLLGAFAFLTTSDLLFYGTVNAGEIDLFYALLIVVHALVIYHYHQSKNYLALFVISYLLTAVGVLTKGIPSLAFQSLTLLGYFAYTRTFIKLFSWQHIIGIVTLSGVLGGYFFAYDQIGDLPSFLVNMFKETSQRTANEYGIGQIIGQLFLFPVMMIKNLFPWSLFLLLFLSKEIRSYIKNNHFMQFVLVFMVSNILIYWTAPELRTRYVYMFVPFLTMLLIVAFQKTDWQSNKFKPVINWLFLIGICAGGLGMMALPFIIQVSNILMIITGIVLGGIVMILGFNHYRNFNSKSSIWLMVLSLLILRLGYNVVVLPEMSRLNKNLIYKEVVSDMIEKAEDRPIMLYGPSEIIIPDVSLFGKVLYNDTLRVPPNIPYQVPYYYANYADRIMYHRTQITDKTVCYLAYKVHTENISKHVLYTFLARNTQLEMELFTID